MKSAVAQALITPTTHMMAVLALSTYGRIPPLAGSMVLTLYVVLELKLGFGAAGARTDFHNSTG